MASLPNVVVVVLDCARADDFPGPTPGIFNRLRRESVVYPRTASVAPWTIPAHASLFTGLYPWEHRAHAKGALPLDPAVPRLPDLLRGAGYASLSLSANPLLNPEVGLVSGFDSAAWSEWWEPYVRNSPRGSAAKTPQRAGEVAATPSSRLQRLHDSPLVSLLHRSADLVYRYPFALSAANHLLQRITSPEDAEPALVARWIDPTFQRWLASVPSDRPVFSFVNLLEAHEPYFVNPDVIHTLTEYWRYVRTWQDRPSVLSGGWAPTRDEVDLLHRLYRGTFRLLEERVGRLVAALESAGRWDETLFILTSDHGQAFLEHGTLFHMHRPDEELLRVPLWVRYPRNEHEGQTAQGWASLIDIFPTILEQAGLALPRVAGVPLPTLIDTPRPTPVYAMADGLAFAQERRQISESRMAWIDRTWVAAYERDRKVTYDVANDRLSAFDIAHDPSEAHDLWPTAAVEFGSLASGARDVARKLMGGPATSISEEVEDRLRSWGYV